ncbi:MAG TPA: hypothetical protein PKC69_14175 [Chitinophagaceae bacterium]|nr:hypothetical protein [Chitinophagaceae bacterium]
MRQLLFFLLVITSLATACNSEKEPSEITLTDEDGKTTKVDISPMAKAAEDMQERIKELQQLTPYTLEEMKALLPEELGGVKRKSFKTSSVMGTSFAEATYELNEESSVELRIYDCAGQAGVGIYNMQFLPMMNMQSESDDEYTRTIDFKGARAIEHLDKTDNDATITWLAKDRLLVSLEGDRTGLDALKQLAGSLPF